MRNNIVISSSAFVAPLVGAWIEINAWDDSLTIYEVAPLVGAWIEILTNMMYLVIY